MSSTYDDLLDATIQHLEELKDARCASCRRCLGNASFSGATGEITPTDLPTARPAGDTGPLTAGTPDHPQNVFHPGPAPAAAPAPVPRPPPPPLEPQPKAAAFAALRARALACDKVRAPRASRKTVVFGVGNPEAQLMFVGEAPGADEDAQGEPFVGRAGELLTKIIQATGLQRGDVYIANILKCRPDTPGQASGNRKPTPEEMATCIPVSARAD